MKTFAATVAVALLLAACGGDDAASEDQTTAQATDTAAQAPSTDDAVEPGDEVEEPTAEEPDTPEPDAQDADAPDDDADTDGAGGVQGVGAATLTIDGEAMTFAGTDFAPETCAPDRFGIFFVVLQQVDDGGTAMPDGLLEATLLHADTDAEVVGQDNRIKVTLGDAEWTADVAEGAGQVDDVSVDGDTASATATFSGAGGTAEGTLEVTCVPAG